MPSRSFLAAAALAAAPALVHGAEVHVDNWADYIAPDTVAKFEAETGIKVVYDVYDSNEVLEAKLLAGNSGYDVVVPTSTFLRRQVNAEVYQPLDRTKLPHWDNLDAALMADAAADDPANAHSAVYLWGTNGIGYNVAKVKERLGEDAPTDSWALVFDPANAARLADCGITMLDTASEMVPLALAWLGLPPDSTGSGDLEKVEELFAAIRPYVRYFNAMQYNTDLAAGEVCVSVGFSGDVFIAADRAAEGVEIAYSVPKEGAMLWFDMLAIPADAPNPDAAHAFIDFLLRPENIAEITNAVFYPNANAGAAEFVDPAILADPAIYPTPEVMARLFPQPVHDARADRTLTRLWTRVRTGQ
jgi:putrescine transport system substrate-binding protein